MLPGLLGLVVALAFGRELLNLIYGPKFAEGAAIFPWIMGVGLVLFVQTPFDYGLTAMHQFKIQPLIFGLAAMINLAGCLMLVPGYGLLGATLGWLGAALCQLVIVVAVHWRRLYRPIGTPMPTAAGPR